MYPDDGRDLELNMRADRYPVHMRRPDAAARNPEVRHRGLSRARPAVYVVVSYNVRLVGVWVSKEERDRGRLLTSLARTARTFQVFVEIDGLTENLVSSNTEVLIRAMRHRGPGPEGPGASHRSRVWAPRARGFRAAVRRPALRLWHKVVGSR